MAHEADNLDLASEREELERQSAMRLRRPAGPQPKGRCHYCDEVVGDNDRWCDIHCREDWERELLLKRNAGK